MQSCMDARAGTITYTERGEVSFYKCGEGEERVWLEGSKILDTERGHEVTSITFDECEAGFVKVALLCLGGDQGISNRITSIRISCLDGDGVFHLTFCCFDNLKTLDLSKCNFTGKCLLSEDGTVVNDPASVLNMLNQLEFEFPDSLQKLLLGSSLMSLEMDEYDMEDFHEALVVIKEKFRRRCDAFRFQKAHKALFEKFQPTS